MLNVPAPVRAVLIAGAALLALFITIEHFRVQRSVRPAPGTSIALAASTSPPEQVRTSANSFELNGYTIKPLAEFTVHARVLSREDYRLDDGASISPIDLALGWQRMTDPKIYGPLNISQGGRWYRYSWQGDPPIPLQEIIESSANMHLIPANPSVERALRQTKQGGYVRLQGKLVEVSRPNGWRWTSSLTRSDSGARACELIYVEAVQVE